MTRLALVMFLTSISFGCGKKDSANASPGSSAPAQASTPAAPGSAAPAPGSDLATTKTLEPSMDVHNLAGNLANEAASRPKIDVTAEKTFDALDKAGVAVVQRKQYLGATAHAAYCAGGKTQDGIAVAICEYADAKTAEAAKTKIVEEWGKATPNARRVINKSTLLTITPLDAKQGELVDRGIAAFNAL